MKRSKRKAIYQMSRAMYKSLKFTDRTQQNEIIAYITEAFRLNKEIIGMSILE